MSPSPRRQQLLDAALRVIAAHGLRGLTHRAVDREAGLAEGSCSAYLRTSSALQQAVAEYVGARLLADVDQLAEALAARDAADSGVAETLELFQRWLEHRELLVARLELTMAATRDLELARLLADHRQGLVEVVDRIMEEHGHEHSTARAEALVASYDGLLLAGLLKPPARRREFLQQSLELMVEQFPHGVEA